MNLRRKKELEIKIVNLTDQLIQSVIAASLKDPEGKTLILEEAEDLIIQLSELIHDLIQDEQYLDSMLNQLVFQKLPDDHILESFEDFNEVLSTLIEKGVHNYRKSLGSVDEEEILLETDEGDIKKEKENVIGKIDIEIESVSNDVISDIIDLKIHSDGKLEDNSDDNLILNINRIYPGLIVYKNISYKGAKFQYYIPDKKLVIEIHENPTLFKKFRGIKEFISSKDGISIIRLSTKYTMASLKKFIK